MKKTIITLLTLTITGCTLGTSTHVGEHFQMSGTPEGIRSFGDSLIGALRTAKEDPKDYNEYFKQRKEYERNITSRQLFKPKSFIDKLFEQDVTDENTVQELK